MKKVLATALILSLSTAILTSPVLADSQEGDQAPKNVIAEKFQVPEYKTIEGTIKEIQDHAWIVTDQGGKEYTVPILGFEQMEDYENLNPAIGTEVTLKGNSINIGDGQIHVARKIESDKEDGDKWNSENISVFKLDGGDGTIEVDREEIQKMMKDVEIGIVKAVKGIPVEGEKNMNKIEGEGVLETINIFKVGDKEGIVELNKGEVLKTMIDKESGAIRVKEGIPAEGKTILKGKEFMKEWKGDLFMASEITANGITLKLPMMRVAMPAISATEAEKE